MNASTQAILLKLCAIGLFTVMDAIMKQLSTHYGPVQVTFFRGLTALPVVLLIVQFQGGVRVLKTQQGWWYFWRGIMSIIMLITTIYAFSEMQLADAYAIFNSAPLFLTLMSVFILKETVGKHRWVALLVGLLGVLIMLRPSGSVNLLATLSCLVATILYAGLLVTMKLMHRHDSSIVQSFYFTLSVCLGSGVLALFSWQPVQSSDFWLLVGLGVTAASAQYLITLAYSRAPASTLAPFEYSAMIWGVGLGYLFWGEIPTPIMLFGASVVVGTGLYILYRERLHERRDHIAVDHPPEIERP